MFNKVKNIVSGLVTSAVVLSGTAFAQTATWDTAAVTAEVTNSRPAIIAVGVAVLGIAGMILGYRMIRKITG